MARKKKEPKPLPTIWHASDELWAAVEQVLAELDPPARYGPERVDQRAAFDGLIFRLRSGCQWNQLPREYGDDSSVHRTFQRWVERGVLLRLWAELVTDCEELGGVDWQWQSADCVMGKARHGGTRSERTRPTGRRTAPKRGVLTEAGGGPVAVVLAPANRHDSTLLCDVLEAVVVEPPDPRAHAQHLCLDKAFVGAGCDATARVFGYEPHVRRIGEEKLDPATGEKKHPARRWVVERTISWLNRCRSLLTRWDKKAANYLGLVQLACALLWYRRKHRLAT